MQRGNLIFSVVDVPAELTKKRTQRSLHVAAEHTVHFLVLAVLVAEVVIAEAPKSTNRRDR